MTTPRATVVLPAFNVAGHLAQTVRGLGESLRERAESWELVIVDDGSHDDTEQEALALLQEFPGTLLTNARNSGKGAAVRQGVLASKGDRILVVDADTSYPPQQVHAFLDTLDQGWDIAVGNRRDPGSRYQLHPSSFRYLYSRHLIGVGFNWLARHLVGIPYLDTQCGFKAFTATAARDVFGRVHLAGYLYDVEALYLAHRLGYRVRSLPVTYLYRGQPSSVRPVLGFLPVIADLLRIRLHHRKDLPR